MLFFDIHISESILRSSRMIDGRQRAIILCYPQEAGLRSYSRTHRDTLRFRLRLYMISTCPRPQMALIITVLVNRIFHNNIIKLSRCCVSLVCDDIKTELTEVSGDSTPSLSFTKYWIAESKCGRPSIFYEDSLSCPNALSISEISR